MNLQAYADPIGDACERSHAGLQALLAIDGQEVRSDVQLAQCISGGLFPRAALALANVIGMTSVWSGLLSPRRRSGEYTKPENRCPG